MISRQLHNEGSRVAGEDLGLLQDDTGNDDGSHADEVGGGCNPGTATKHSSGDHADDRHLSTAGDEGGGHDGHLTVTVIFDGTGGHNTGNAAAGTDQHGDEALAGQTELTEDTVHDEGDTSHVANVFQDSQQEEQHQHLRHEAQHGANAAHDTVNDQAGQPGSGTDALQPGLDVALQEFTYEHIVGPVGRNGADGGHGDVVHQPHHHSEDGQCSPAVGHHTVNLIGGGQGSLGLALLHAGGNQLVDVSIALVGDDGLSIIVHFLLAVSDDLFDLALHIGRQGQLLSHLFVTLEELDGEPALQVLLNLHVLKQILNVSNGMLNAALEHMGRLTVTALGSQCGSSFSSLHTALALQCRGLNHFALECFAQLLHVDLVTVLAGDVDHVQCHDHGDTQLSQLRGQVQVTLDVGSVNNVQDGVRLFVDQIATSHHFFQRVRRKAVNAGQVLNDYVCVALELAFLLFYSNAGPVTNVLIRTRQGIEHGSFTTVRVACQGNFNRHVESSLKLSKLLGHGIVPLKKQ